MLKYQLWVSVRVLVDTHQTLQLIHNLLIMILESIHVLLHILLATSVKNSLSFREWIASTKLKPQSKRKKMFLELFIQKYFI
jgi:hypothetical protein